MQYLLILDFGSQYSQLIARRVREIGVYCEVHPYHTAAEILKKNPPAGIILSGGPDSINVPNAPRVPAEVFMQECPILGICYGMQAMAVQLGGQVSDEVHSEFGYAQLCVQEESPLFHGIADHLREDGAALLDVWMSHGDQVSQLPPGFRALGHTKNTVIAVMGDVTKKFYGVQFHPEVTHTHQGKRILERFVHEICQCEKRWTPQKIITNLITKIQQAVRQDKVILGLSGGVDSLVAAVLLQKAIGKQLICIYVDHGLQRHAEAELLRDVQTQRLQLNVIHVDAAERFLTALRGITEPEQKRKIIGKLFIEVFTEEAAKIPQAKWLAQGTIYSDVIESAHSGKQTHTIKSHHNVGGLPETLSLQLIEPLRELFKDEVRKIGLELGLPYDEVYRHPFPGPGLAVRIIGEVTTEALEKLRHADTIFIEELRRHDFYHKVAQAFCVFLPIKSVGVIGDARQYAHIIGLRAVESTDYMTARWAHLPHELLAIVSQRIVNEVPGISRVVYDITDKPPATIEWE